MGILSMMFNDCYNICILLANNSKIYLSNYDIMNNIYEWSHYENRAMLINKDHAEKIFECLKQSGEFNKFENYIYYKIEKDTK